MGRSSKPSTSAGRFWLAGSVLLAGAICFLFMYWQRRYDLNLADEGFLWYGAQRIGSGELPLRDFQSYDPGRYFWAAAWMGFLGDDGVVALRIGNAVWGAITVWIATWAVTLGRGDRGPLRVLIVGLIFALWMVPAYKVSDSFALVLLMLGLTRLVQRPTAIRCFQAGLCWGMAAMIGINHALYGAVAGLFTFLYVGGTPHPVRSAISAFGGAVAGYSPVIALHAIAPGFTAAYLDGIARLFEYGETNQALPFPTILGFLQVPQMGFLMAATETLAGLLFIGVPILWLLLSWHLRRHEARARATPIIPAALILSLPYAHYAYSRADPLHVAVSVLPVMAAMLAVGLEARLAARRVILAATFLFSLIFTAHMHPGYYHLRGYLTEAVTVRGDRLLVRPQTAASIRAVQKVAQAAGSANFFAGPYMPGAYALAGRKAPVWEIYMLFPARPARQQAEIARLKRDGVRHALIKDERADGRPDLGLAQTHPLIFDYLQKCLQESKPLSPRPPLLALAAKGDHCRY